MKIRETIRDIILNFVFVFIILLVSMYLYNQIAMAETYIDWDKLISYTAVFGIIFTFIKLFDAKKKKKKDED